MNVTKTVKIPPSNTKILNFNVPKLKEGIYTLETEGINGLIFKNSSSLNFSPKNPKIHIQTDKAVYKPGDLIQYRIIVLDENTKPAKLDKSLRLEFKDAAGNFVKQINDIQLNKGVYMGELQLSEEPVLGVWSMKAILGSNEDNTKRENKFEVDKYVLPKFSVDIETTKNVYYKDPVKITVSSKYTYGKPVKGQALIKVASKYGQLKLEKTIDVEGNGYAEFELDKVFELADPIVIYDELYYMQPVAIFVEMSEEYTGNKYNKTITIHLHRSRYNIIKPWNVNEFVVNQTFQIKVYVKNLDGSPVQNGKHLAKLTINKNDKTTTNEGNIEFLSPLDKNGMALFNVTLNDTGHYYQVNVTYAKRVEFLGGLLGKKLEDQPEEYVKSLQLIRLTQE